ncbi:MAG: acyltransferase family protein [Cyanobium sp.]
MSLSITAVNPRSESRGSQYRPEIDGLRALALLAVIAYHFSSSLLPGGYLGVDIFFVISGYVINKSLLKRPRQSFREGLVSFYARRIKRLVPALAFCIILTSILACLFDPAPGVSLQTGLTALFGLSNLYLFSQSTDYFAPSTELNVFTQTWSLGVEEQFYLVYPFLLLAAGFWAGKVRSAMQGGKANGSVGKLFLLIFTLSAASLIFYIAATASNVSAGYFLMPARFWELGSGCLLAIGEQRLSEQKKPNDNWAMRSAPLLSLIGFAFAFNAPYDQAIAATITVIALTILLIATIHSNKTALALMSHPLAVWIGLISYSLYLWHWSVISLSRWTVGIQWWTWPFQLTVMLLISCFSYYCIERPLRHANWSDFDPWTIGKGLLATSAAAGALIVLGKPFEGKLFLGNGGKVAEKQRLASSMFSDRAMDQHVDAANRKSEKILSSCNITPFLLGNGSKYSLGPVDEGFLKQCIRPAGESEATKPNLVVVGDSFAEKLMPHAALAAFKSSFSFGGVYGYGCAYGLRSGLILHPSFPRCRYINEDLLENALFNALNPGDVVLLRYHLPNKSYVRYPTGHSQPSPSAYDKAIAAFLAKASSRGAKVILIGPNPTLSTQEMMALRPEWFNAWNRKQQIAINNGQLSLYFDQLDTHLQYISKTWGPHRYLSLRPFICATDKSCTLAKGNKFLYSDDHHLSPYGHDLFFGTLMAAINPGRGKSSLDAKSMSSHGNQQ